MNDKPKSLVSVHEFGMLFNFQVSERNLKKGHKVEPDALYGGVAQLGEHLLCKQGVRSSILLISTINRKVEKGNGRNEELPSDDMGA